MRVEPYDSGKCGSYHNDDPLIIINNEELKSSKLPEKFEYYMPSDIYSSFKSSTTQYCVVT